MFLYCCLRRCVVSVLLFASLRRFCIAGWLDTLSNTVEILQSVTGFLLENGPTKSKR